MLAPRVADTHPRFVVLSLVSFLPWGHPRPPAPQQSRASVLSAEGAPRGPPVGWGGGAMKPHPHISSTPGASPERCPAGPQALPEPRHQG